MKKLFTCLLLLIFFTTANAQYVELDNYFVRKALIKVAPTCFDEQERLDTTCAKLQEIKNFDVSDDELVSVSNGEINEELYNEIFGENIPWNFTFTVNGLQYLTDLQTLRINFGYMAVNAVKKHLPQKLNCVYASSWTYSQEDYGGLNIEIPDSVKYVNLTGFGFHQGKAVVCMLPLQLEELVVIGPNSIKGIMNTKVKKITSSWKNVFIDDFKEVPNTVEEIHFSDIFNDGSFGEDFNPKLPQSLSSLKKLIFENIVFEENNSFLDISNLNQLEEISFINSENYELTDYPSRLKKIIYNGCLGSIHGYPCEKIPQINLELPERLESLTISNFPKLEFTEPTYPQSLQELTLSNINISVLNELPSTLKSLDISSNKLEIIESIPGQLESLNVSGNSNLKCLPTLPASLKTINVSASKVTCIPNETNTIKATAALPLCPEPCGQIPDLLSGLVFLDLNKNGRFDWSDQRIQGAFIHANDKILTTNINGEYRFYTNPDAENNISVTYKHPHLDKILPAQRTYTNSGNSEKIDTMNFAVQLRDVKDVEVLITPFIARNGFTPTTSVTVTNRGTLPVYNFNLSLHTPLHWTLTNTTPIAQSISDSILWNNISLDPNTSRTFQVSLTIPATDSIDTPFALTAKTHQVTDDETPQNNTFTFSSRITGSYDPNDKLVYPESLTPGYPEGTELIYTVRFQNTGNDTAFTVVVKDTIQTNLDPLSFRFISGSHPSVWSLNEQGIITFTFENILLPDSNTNEPASNGQVTFAIQPKAGLVSGTSVENKAAIYFDFNAPIITNTAVARVEVITAVNKRNAINMTAYPNPAKDIIHLQWADGGKSYLSVSDISGKIVSQAVMNGNYIQLPVNHLSKGMYIVQIQNELGTGIAKVIVQ